MSAGRPGRRYAVIYDGECRVCRRFVAHVAEWDSQAVLEIAASQAPGIAVRFPWISPHEFKESVQVVRLEDGKTWRGAAALEQLLKVLPRGRLVSWLFSVPLVRGVAERFYRAFARNRYRLRCGEHCRTQ